MKLIAAILALITSTSVSARAQDAIRISGMVVDTHGEAISGSQVSCVGSPKPAVADSEGKFTIDCLSPQLRVIATGFAPATVDYRGGSIVVTLTPAVLLTTLNVTRVETTVGSTASSVIALASSELESAGALTLDDRLRQIPGFTLFRRAGSSTANPTTQGVSMRGVGASGASRALVLNDGVPLNDPFGGWVYWARVPEESIASVELIRGPASDLYGSTAVGGVISVVDHPSTASPFADLDIAYGTEHSPFASFFGGLGNGTVRGSLASELYRTDGFVPTAPEPRGAVDRAANVSRYSLRPRVDYLHRNVSAFAALGLYQERRHNGSPLQNNDTRIADITIGADAATRHAGTFSGRVYSLTEKYHQSFSAIAANRQMESLNRLQTVPSQAIGASGQWTATIRKHVVFAGADIRQIRGRSDETAISNGVATSLSTSGGRETTLGSFAGASFDLGKVTLSGGLRYDAWWNSRGYSATRPLTAGTPTLTRFADRFESRVSPRISILARLTPHISVSGLFSTAFRQPTLNELYRSFRVGNVLTLANDSLTAERATDAEAAIVVNALDRRIFLRAGPFCTWVTNTVSNVTLTTTPSLITRQRQNLGSTRSCGLETDFRMEPSSEWSLSAGYLIVDPVVTSMPGTATLVGLTLPEVARQQFTVNVRYSPRLIGTFAAQFRTSSSQWEDDLNTLRLAPYATLDLFASHDITRRVTLYLAAQNITNTRIESGRTPVLTLAQPRTIRVGVQMKFGRK